MGFRKEGSKPPTHIILDNIRIFGKDTLQIKRKKRVSLRKNKSKRGKFRSNNKRKRRNKKKRK
jgi:hypothetical protein